MYDLKVEPEDFIVREVPNFELGDGPYGIYLLKKRDYGTVKVLSLLVNFLGCNMRDIGFAGNKDRRAVTEQYISIKFLSKERVLSFKNDLIELEYVGQSRKPISLGGLIGNEFEIVVRNCSKSPKETERFVNYFGEQRFSTHNVEIGRRLLKKDFVEVVDLLVETGLFADKIEEHLDKNKNDFVGAICLIPMKTLSIFISSFQSYIWNRVVSSRIETICDYTKKGEIEISGEVLNVGEGADMEIPIVGFETENVPVEAEHILLDEGLSLRDFIIPQIQRLSAGGTFREAFVDVKGYSCESVSDGVYRVKFQLPKGCYATVFIRHLFI